MSDPSPGRGPDNGWSQGHHGPGPTGGQRRSRVTSWSPAADGSKRRLLAGGLDRGNEFDELIPYLKNVKALITFGQTAPKIERVGRDAGIKMIERVDNVEKAVPVAFQYSEPGDVILLSPACASWDQFKTFEVRGDIFIEAVHKLK